MEDKWAYIKQHKNYSIWMQHNLFDAIVLASLHIIFCHGFHSKTLVIDSNVASTCKLHFMILVMSIYT